MTIRNLTRVQHQTSAHDRQARFGHAGGVLWLTGLSASGKSTLAMGLEKQLLALGYACYTLDGDNIRHGLNRDLGFSAHDRTENIRRVSEVAALFADSGLICITAFISPYRADRAQARQTCAHSSFHEVYVSADLATCELRDPKGLYRKARNGELSDFSGISAPYEAPLSPELTIDTGQISPDHCIKAARGYVVRNFPVRT
jgi:adenylyl-sulfate kinase